MGEYERQREEEGSDDKRVVATTTGNGPIDH
jgi:hypothetical protein